MTVCPQENERATGLKRCRKEAAEHESGGHSCWLPEERGFWIHIGRSNGTIHWELLVLLPILPDLCGNNCAYFTQQDWGKTIIDSMEKGRNKLHLWIWYSLCVASGWCSPALAFTSRVFFYERISWKLVTELEEWKIWGYVYLRRKVQTRTILCSVPWLLKEGLLQKHFLFWHIFLGNLWTGWSETQLY